MFISLNDNNFEKFILLIIKSYSIFFTDVSNELSITVMHEAMPPSSSSQRIKQLYRIFSNNGHNNKDILRNHQKIEPISRTRPPNKRKKIAKPKLKKQDSVVESSKKTPLKSPKKSLFGEVRTPNPFVNSINKRPRTKTNEEPISTGYSIPIKNLSSLMEETRNEVRIGLSSQYPENKMEEEVNSGEENSFSLIPDTTLSTGESPIDMSKWLGNKDSPLSEKVPSHSTLDILPKTGKSNKSKSSTHKKNNRDIAEVNEQKSTHYQLSGNLDLVKTEREAYDVDADGIPIQNYSNLDHEGQPSGKILFFIIF